MSNNIHDYMGDYTSHRSLSFLCDLSDNIYSCILHKDDVKDTYEYTNHYLDKGFNECIFYHNYPTGTFLFKGLLDE